VATLAAIIIKRYCQNTKSTKTTPIRLLIILHC
jgi:hypothetical protein